jgi:hypothetical protein
MGWTPVGKKRSSLCAAQIGFHGAAQAWNDAEKNTKQPGLGFARNTEKSGRWMKRERHEVGEARIVNIDKGTYMIPYALHQTPQS